ncbi:PocR ligand-binding domain-containing protein [Oceanirhabdus sp. W0125-5]|uniref:PocR ligand-binding domain-containing protein n=1 Tax=Oceanirhabdus sp. W0125-5 TaxID=2999116 RepID=UPI0022F2BB4C|nr:PocR ligand-binding domain-containing protein [Oceanirhabdus sp. W0125-5]WBW96600.1 PocR ligand-binding domain-containing protein [Oceanirhabdus sp. W0125-5]
MKYDITNLIDIPEFEKLMEEFYNITRIPHALIDIDGNIINAVGSQDLCMKFHRMNPESLKLCKQSDLSIKSRINNKKEYNVYVCQNGLVEAVTPIIIEDKHIGSLIFGQFFFTKPDVDFFKKQASNLGFNVDDYLESLSKVPIISEDKVKSYMQYLTN